LQAHFNFEISIADLFRDLFPSVSVRLPPLTLCDFSLSIASEKVVVLQAGVKESWKLLEQNEHLVLTGLHFSSAFDLAAKSVEVTLKVRPVVIFILPMFHTLMVGFTTGRHVAGRP
jgi:hypothetical protein